MLLAPALDIFASGFRRRRFVSRQSAANRAEAATRFALRLVMIPGFVWIIWIA